jgi:hypothetical protein
MQLLHVRENKYCSVIFMFRRNNYCQMFKSNYQQAGFDDLSPFGQKRSKINHF